VRLAADELHAEVTGLKSGQPVLLLHGWGSSGALMRPLAERLESYCNVHNVDLPGHGHSPPPKHPMGVPEHAELVSEYVSGRMGGGPVTLVGHSNGGRIGLFMAAQPEYRSVFDRLILISPSGITPRRTAKYHFKRAVARMLRMPARFLPARASAFFNDWMSHSLLWRALGSSEYNALTGVMRQTFVQTVNLHVDDLIDRIEIPVLILWGDRDAAVRRDQVETLAARIPDSGLFILEGAGHYGHLDATDAVAGACRSMIAGSQ